MADDMFTLLPECLLVLIIGFLPFEQAARTSVLSRRWRHIWRSTNNVDFNQSFFINRANGQMQTQLFIDFMQQWIANFPQPTLDKFSLTFSHPGGFPAVVENCIRFALQRNVKHLALDFSDPTWDENDLDEIHEASFDLPLYASLYRGFESLTLVSCNFDMNGFRNFNRLTQVSLGWVELPLIAIRALLENCGMLESLTLKHCWNIDSLEIRGTNLRLRSLVVEKCIFLNSYFSFQVPNLKYFKYIGQDIHAIDAHISGGLEEADLDFGVQSTLYDDIGDVLYQVLSQLFPMRLLTVCTYMLQGIPLGEEPLGLDPRDRLRVTHLTLKTTMHDFELFGIAFLLKSCPFLEVLTIELHPGRIFHEEYVPPFELYPLDSFWRRHGIVYRFMKRTLRVVQVKGFKGTQNELYLLAHLLAHARVIVKLDVFVSQEVGSNGRNPQLYRIIAQQLHRFRRASHNLQITIL